MITCSRSYRCTLERLRFSMGKRMFRHVPTRDLLLLKKRIIKTLQGHNMRLDLLGRLSLVVDTSMTIKVSKHDFHPSVEDFV